ncbi:MAG: translocation/assembly module TamB domain-containing protein [Bacteroidales bacterium]
MKNEAASSNGRKLFGKILKWVLRVVLALVLLLLLVIALVQIPAVQTYITSRIVSTFSERTGTTMDVGRVVIRFPTKVAVEEIYVEDNQGDTLLYAGDIEVDVNILALIRSRVSVSNISVEQLYANILKRSPDTVFNYQFIVDAFAGEPDSLQQDTTQGNGMVINLDRVNLDDIRVRYSDYQQGIDLRVVLGQMQTRITKFNPDSFAYHLDEIQLVNSLVELQMSQPTIEKAPQPDQPAPAMDLMLEQLTLDHFAFRMQAADGSEMEVNIPQLQAQLQDIDMNQNLVHLDDFSARELVFAMQSPPGQQPAEEQPGADEEFSFRWSEMFEWDIQVDNLDVGFSELSMTTAGSGPSSQDFDPANLQFSNLVLQAENIVVNPRAVRMNLQMLSANHPSGFRLEELSADIDLEQTLQIEDVTLRTNRTQLRFDFVSDLNPLNFSSNEIEDMEVNLNVRQGDLASDLSFFYPPLQNLAGDIERIHVVTHLHGSLANLSLDHLRANAPGLLSASLEQGTIRGLPQVDNLVVDFPRILLQARPTQIMAMLPDTLPAAPVTLPDTMSLEGSFSGGMKAFMTEMALNSSLGNIELSAEFDNTGQNSATYQGQVNLQNIQAGTIMQQQEMMGPVTARLSVSGTGLEPEIADGEFKLVVSNATFNQYEYKGLELSGTIQEGIIKSLLEYNDENLVLEASQQVMIADENPAIQLSWNLSRANLQELNFTEQLVMARTRITADLRLVEDFAEGKLIVNGLQVRENDQVFTLDNLTVQTALDNDNYQVSIESSLIQADYQGNFSPAGVPAALSNHLDRYVSLSLPEDTLNHEGKQFSLTLNVPPSEWLTDFLMPSMSFPEPIQMEVDFDYDAQTFSADINARQFSLGNIVLDAVAVTASTDAAAGALNATVEGFEMNALRLTDVLLQAQLQDDVIDFLVEFDDRFQELWLSLPGTLSAREDQWELSLDSDLVINRNDWNASTDNYVVFGGQTLFVNNLKLQNQEKSLLIHSLDEQQQGDSAALATDTVLPLNITFNEFQLNDFSVLEEEPLLGGLFNGYVTINDVFSDIAFTADLSIEDFSFGSDTIGSIDIQASNPQPDLFTLDASVQGSGNDIEVTGSYLTGADPELDVALILTRANLKTLEGLLEGTLSDLSGNISGRMMVKGNPSDPDFDGTMRFDQVAFHLALSNVGYTIPDETISFDRNMVQFDNFTLIDDRKGEASVDGQVNLRNMPDVIFDLNLTTDNFRLLDAPPGQNDLFSGNLLVDSDLSLQGDITRPVVQGLVRLNEGSRFNFTIPQAAPGEVGAEGIVEFINYSDTLFQDVSSPADTIATVSAFQNLDLSINVEIDPETRLRIVVDEAAGDNLELTGGGVLSLGMNPGGDFSLSGRYEIQQGSYLLTFYNALRRNFVIQQGSTIQWRGDPMDALVDITAIYTVTTSARELLVSQGEEGGGESAALRQQFPFEVLLNMDGELENPEISFDIRLPAEERNALDGRVQARLDELNQSESELNKQVFALLVLGSFIQDNPFAASGGGGGMEGAARNSVSRILSQQLNRLSDRYVKGVNINFDVESYEDYTTGQAEGRTELQMEVSKDFLDERLRITVGGNIELEDETRQETNAGEIAGDFLLEYLLNPDGTFILKAFRTKDFGDLFEAQVIETGVSLLFTRSYNVFRELFSPKEDPFSMPDNTQESEPDSEDQ